MSEDDERRDHERRIAEYEALMAEERAAIAKAKRIADEIHTDQEAFRLIRELQRRFPRWNSNS